jgi:hypothetical protein
MHRIPVPAMSRWEGRQSTSSGSCLPLLRNLRQRHAAEHLLHAGFWSGLALPRVSHNGMRHRSVYQQCATRQFWARLLS